MESIEGKIARLIRTEIRALKAYHVPEATGMVKLDAMENPYGWPEELKREWCEALKSVALNRYPDPAANALRARLKQVYSVPAGMELMLGNGSDELIQIILMSLARPGAVVLAPVPTFVMYEMTATMAGMKFVGVPLTPDFALDTEAMLEDIAHHKPAVVFLAWPNNPTGNLFDAAAVEEIVRRTQGLVVVDEAYHAFCQQSFMDRLGLYDNLLVMRTLSKQGLAGLRLGVLAGEPRWIEEFNKVRLPYNINSLSQASAEFALKHQTVLDEQAARIRADRETLYTELADLPGLTVWPSSANFILFRVEGRPVGELFAALKGQGILIKNLDGSHPALAGCLRVTVGAPEENTRFLAALKKAVLYSPHP
ncbi:MAG: histidinol-phosphate transaminase [Gammaproteobacteria bacterium]|nr:MAG: histidinol-phosphate transaminase [Gammaproteobacteria bacterium]